MPRTVVSIILMKSLTASLKAFTTAALLAGSLAYAQPDLPLDGVEIESIEIEGLERANPAQVRRVLTLREGAEFTRINYDQSQKNLARLLFLDPLETEILWEYTDTGVALTIQAVENPIVQSIEFVGNVEFSEEELRARLDFEEGDPLPTGARASVLRAIRNFYRNGGYNSVRVSVSVRDREEGVALLVTVDEGARIKIKDIELDGNTQFSEFYVSMRLINAPGILFFNNYFDENALDDDVAILRELYQNKGYLDAEVSAGELEYDREKQEVVVHFDIVQGPRYEVKDVRAEGVTLFTKEEIASASEILPERTFDGGRMTQVLANLQKLYGNQGYIDTEITYRTERDPETAAVDIVFQVQEEPVRYVGIIEYDREEFDYDLDLNWLERIADWLAPPLEPEAVYREVRLEPGEKYRLSDEERTVQRLRRLGVFRSVRVQRLPNRDGDPNLKDAVIVAEEDPAAAFIGVTAGVGDFAGAFVTFEFSQPNWTGHADQLRASATFGTRTVYYRLGYLDRYIGDSDTSVSYSIYHLRERLRAYRQRTTGGEVEFGQPLDEFLTGYAGLRGERVDFSGYEDDVETDLDGYYVLAFRPSLDYDRRDDYRYPTKGYRVGGAIETGTADGFLLKFLHDYQSFHKLNRRNLVYAYGHNVGLLPYDADQIGLSERFFIGGSQTLRGFRYKEVGPRDGNDDDLAIGGATSITQRHELRYPFTENFRGRLFTDIGLIDEEVLTPGEPRVGVGPGISFDLGPLVIDADIGFAVIREDTDRTQHLHLRVGSRF